MQKQECERKRQTEKRVRKKNDFLPFRDDQGKKREMRRERELREWLLKLFFAVGRQGDTAG